jgi:hypothetical protein
MSLVRGTLHGRADVLWVQRVMSTFGREIGQEKAEVTTAWNIVF